MHKKNHITIKDVAAHAGVSPSTVSRVLNATCPVSHKHRDRVLEAVESLGYQPNYFSRALVSKRSHSIGMIVKSLSGYFFGEIMYSAELSLRQAGQELVVANGQGNREQEEKALDFLLSRRCDAIIIFSDCISDEKLHSLNQNVVPIVIVTRHVAGLEDRSIVINCEKGSYDATTHLINLGHQDIAFITGPMHNQEVQERIHGYRRALNKAGIEYKPELLLDSSFMHKDGERLTKTLLEKNLPLTAIMYGNDELAMAGMKSLHAANLAIPNDISIIGFDNSWVTPYLIPELTTVHSPVTEIAQIAAELAVALVEGREYNSQLEKETHLVIRNSTASPKQ